MLSPNPPTSPSSEPDPILYIRGGLAAPTQARRRLLHTVALYACALGFLAGAWSGCARASYHASDAAPPPRPAAPEDSAKRAKQPAALDVSAEEAKPAQPVAPSDLARPSPEPPSKPEPAKTTSPSQPAPEPGPGSLPSPAPDVMVIESDSGWFEGDTFDDHDDPRAEVAALVESIEGLTQDSTQPQDPSAGPQAGCSRVCQAQDAICTSSSKICTIAQRNPQEPYFAERCTWSKGACTQAQTRCSACVP